MNPQKNRSLLVFVTLVGFIVIGYVIWQTNHLSGQLWDYDEGVWASEARLLNQGFALYREVYVPAPPLFVVTLAAGFRLFGESLETARLVSLLLSSLGLVAVALVGRKLFNGVAGVAALLFLAFSPDFYMFSRLPNGNLVSMGIVMWAIFFALLYRDTGRLKWLYLASMVASIGLFFKFVPGFMVPVLAYLVGRHHFATNQPIQKKIGKFLADGVHAAIPFFLVLIACLLVFDASAFTDQVFLHHLSGRNLGSYPPELVPSPLDPLSAAIVNSFTAIGALSWNTNILSNLIFFLINYRALTLLALLGFYPLHKTRPDNAALMLFWLAATAAMSLLHQPMFGHLFAIYLYPLALLAGVSTAWLMALLKQLVRQRPVQTRRLIATAIFAGALGAYLVGLPATLDYFSRKSAAPELPVYTGAIEALQQQTTPDDWIITDIQAIAFLADRNVPPPLAETSNMRYANNRLQTDDLKRWTEKYRPKVIITGRVFLHLTEYTNWLPQNYNLVWGDDVQRFYIYLRKD
jgi:4-amino-4-deoxy-L-arabinose transferase-like glycosyltransferase